MKQLSRWIAALGLIGLAACGQNPLLRTVASDFAPIRVGSQWGYVDSNGAAALTRSVTGSGPVQGREAFTVVSQAGPAPATTDYWSLNSGAFERYDATLGWVLLRRLPYVYGNKWALATGDPLVTALQTVEGIETVTVPAGKFEACYRLKTKTSTYDPVNDVTATAESLVWAAPDVGDVRYADIDGAGNANITLQLSSYRIPR